MASPDRLHDFFKDLCIGFVGALRSLALYPREHPGTRNKVQHFTKRLQKYLEQRPALTLLIVNGEVIIENQPLPELGDMLGQLLQRFEAMKLQSITFRRGILPEEILTFMEALVHLLKSPEGADLVLAKIQKKTPHLQAGSLPFETSAQVSFEEFTGALQAARESVLSLSEQLGAVFAEVDGPLTEAKANQAKDTAANIQKMTTGGEMPLKLLVYRRSSDPDPLLHAIHVSALSMHLSRLFEVPETDILDIGTAALLHDIGLHLSSRTSFSKTAAVTLDEKKIQWEHPVRGAEILLATPGLPDLAALVAYEHHLYYDGRGYPKLSRPHEPNFASLITCVTNSYDNLRRNRPERKAYALTDTLDWMDRQAGVYFHPFVLKQFRAMVKALADEEL